MNDRLIMENYLLILKSTVEVYVHGTLESSNKSTREVLKQGLDNTMTSQASTYDLMKEHGWYQVNNVTTDKIQQTITKINSQTN